MSSFFPLRQRILGVILTTAFSPMMMWGGNNAWISGDGLDGGSCQYSSPCASFGYASQLVVDNNPAKGEIFVLNPGVYAAYSPDSIGGGVGPINGGKSQTWDGGEGNLATIVGNNIPIAIGSGGFNSSNVIILRNLTLIGENFIGPAIQTGTFFNGATLIIENCKIYGYSPSAGTGIIDCRGGGPVIIKDTIIESNAGDAIIVSGVGNVSLSRLAIKNNAGNGVNISGGAVVDISDSIITQNTGSAILAAGDGTVINCINDVLTSNGVAIETGNMGIVRISNNDIYNNTDFIQYDDDTGVVNTANNNRVGSNGSSPMSPTGSITIQ